MKYILRNVLLSLIVLTFLVACGHLPSKQVRMPANFEGNYSYDGRNFTVKPSYWPELMAKAEFNQFTSQRQACKDEECQKLAMAHFTLRLISEISKDMIDAEQVSVLAQEHKKMRKLIAVAPAAGPYYEFEIGESNPKTGQSAPAAQNQILGKITCSFENIQANSVSMAGSGCRQFYADAQGAEWEVQLFDFQMDVNQKNVVSSKKLPVVRINRTDY